MSGHSEMNDFVERRFPANMQGFIEWSGETHTAMRRSRSFGAFTVGSPTAKSDVISNAAAAFGDHGLSACSSQASLHYRCQSQKEPKGLELQHISAKSVETPLCSPDSTPFLRKRQGSLPAPMSLLGQAVEHASDAVILPIGENMVTYDFSALASSVAAKFIPGADPAFVGHSPGASPFLPKRRHSASGLPPPIKASTPSEGMSLMATHPTALLPAEMSEDMMGLLYPSIFPDYLSGAADEETSHLFGASSSLGLHDATSTAVAAASRARWADISFTPECSPELPRRRSSTMPALAPIQAPTPENSSLELQPSPADQVVHIEVSVLQACSPDTSPCLPRRCADSRPALQPIDLSCPPTKPEFVGSQWQPERSAPWSHTAGFKSNCQESGASQLFDPLHKHASQIFDPLCLGGNASTSDNSLIHIAGLLAPHMQGQQHDAFASQLFNQLTAAAAANATMPPPPQYSPNLKQRSAPGPKPILLSAALESPVSYQAPFGRPNFTMPVACPTACNQALPQLLPPPPQYAAQQIRPEGKQASFAPPSQPAEKAPGAMWKPPARGDKAPQAMNDASAEVTEAATDDNASPVTTLMIRNLPKSISQIDLISELNSCGFEGSYDFIYMPQSFSVSENVGFAFVNFISPIRAGALVGLWHRQRRFGIGQKQPALNISPADIQGLEANIKKWASPRLRRIRNKNLRPFVLDEKTKTLRSLIDEELGRGVN